MDGNREQMRENAGHPADDQHPAPRSSPSRPRDRNNFEIAIICALPLEASAVSALFDKRWDDQRYGRAPTDSNAYSTGVIGHHNVVLVHMPNMGKVAAATAAACLRSSFPEIQLALVVGICGGAPFGNRPRPPSEDIFLGDVIISEGLIQYDLGRQFPNNIFMRRDTPRDNLPRPGPKIRAALAKLQTEQGRSWLEDKTSEYLRVLRQRLGDMVTYPGPTEDRLFKPTYQHKHHTPLECAICAKDDGRDNVCKTVVGLSCEQIKCEEQELVPRVPLSRPFNPVVHFGLIASGDTVMKSGEDRDDIATRDGVIAFEMEGAGVWENFPGSLVIKGVCDYADSHKSKEWQNYAAATAAAVTKGFLENWNTGPPRQPSPRLRTTKEIDILKRLNKSPYRDRKERNPERIHGTCEWFLTHELFRDWHESKSSTMLWVSADPGCGKSVLVKHLADSILATNKSRTTCYFFFKDDFEDQRNAISALCCILHQLFKQKRILLSENILEQFEVEGERLSSSFSDLWAILLSAAKDKNAGEIVCLLDAFDECEDHGRSQLAQALCKLYDTKSSFNLKFLLTSRPYGGIRRGFQPLEIPELPVIHLSGESDIEMKKISREIDIFIKARVRNIGGRLKLRNDEQELLLQELIHVPNRTYLWVHLTLDLIENDIDIDKTGIVNATSHLPKTVDEAYDRILSKSHDFKKAKRILHIIVAAARPLTLKEMALALTIRGNHRSYRDVDLKSEDRFRETIRDICGLFVTIIGSKIYLLHQTAKEFLVQHDQNIHPESGGLQWKRSLRPPDSHRVLTKICMRYLLFAEFEANPLENDAMLSQYSENHVFLDYSAKHWASHVRESHIEVDDVATQSMLRLCDTSSKCFLTWFRIHWASTNTDFPKSFTSLMIASYFGLAAVVKHLLELDSIDLNAKDGTYGRSAISWAAGNGFDVVVELLIKGIGRRLKGIKLPIRKKAKVDSVDRYGRTPLVYAVWNGHVAAVKRLVEAGARINLADDIGGTALSYAVCSGHNEVLTLLLKKGTKAGSEDDTRMALLLSAAEKDHEAVVKLLLETGKIDLELKDRNGRTPLSCAVEGRSVAIVRLLLTEGVETDYKYKITPLSRAAEMGDERVVKLLLENGALPNFKDEGGQTPLSRAVEEGNVAVVQVLLANKEVKKDYKYKITPLSRAAEKGDERVVKLLLENGACPDFKVANGKTPLSRAVEKVDERVVQLLLENGARPDLESKSGKTPLSRAAEKGDERVVKLLLENGACPDFKDEKGKTPLSRAVGKGDERVVKLLLENGARPDLESKSGRTPLSRAARKGDERVVKLLLENGARPDFKDKHGKTPLSRAEHAGKAAVVELLNSYCAP
ncbi:ankyrin repeat-containing domain protein [Elaphomyces granulatus]